MLLRWVPETVVWQLEPEVVLQQRTFNCAQFVHAKKTGCSPSIQRNQFTDL